MTPRPSAVDRPATVVADPNDGATNDGVPNVMARAAGVPAAAANSATPRAPWRWLAIVRLPRRLGRQVLGVSAALADHLGTLPRWIGAGVLLGVAPLCLDYWLESALHPAVIPLLVFPVLLAAVARDAFARGVGFLGALLVAHCLVAVLLSALDPERMALVLEGGADYWHKSERWIRGFENPEYHPSSWLPAQVQLFGAFCFYAYLSLGMAPLLQGFYELGLMNYYVGRLAAESADPALALALGWHPWSWCRGLGYLFLTFELSSLALQQLTGAVLSTRRRRLLRWSLGLAFLTGDIVIKYTSMAAVREALAANLP